MEPLKFVLATHNPGKLKEMSAILGALGVEVVSPSDLGLTVDVEETGETFAENAMTAPGVFRLNRSRAGRTAPLQADGPRRRVEVRGRRRCPSPVPFRDPREPSGRPAAESGWYRVTTPLTAAVRGAFFCVFPAGAKTRKERSCKMKYDFTGIEKKWQAKWLEEKPFAAVNGDTSRPKFYGLIEFPYPSGQGLHVGHPRPYTAMKSDPDGRIRDCPSPEMCR